MNKSPRSFSARCYEMCDVARDGFKYLEEGNDLKPLNSEH